jgi:hypothetical protein
VAVVGGDGGGGGDAGAGKVSLTGATGRDGMGWDGTWRHAKLLP